MGRKRSRGLLIVAVFGLLAGLSITEYWVMRYGPASPPASTKDPIAVFWGSFRYYLAWAILTPGIFWLGRRVPLRARRWWRAVAFHLLVSVACSAPVFMLTVVLGMAAGHGPASPGYVISEWWRIRVGLVLSVLPVYWLILGTGTAMQVYRDRRANQIQTAELRRLLATAELDALRMKLHPHFLFNTLNAIACLAQSGEMAAVEQVIEHLGTLLRLSMETSGRQLVTLEEELALLDEQLAIEEIRFGDRLHVVRRVEPASCEALVPNLILQPLVENAIAHGISRRLDASLLEISARRDGPNLRVVIRDDGPGLPPGWRLATHARRGLTNVMERLRTFYAASFQLDIVNSATGGTIADLRLPFNLALPALAGSWDHGIHQDDHR
jgi:two-component system LytT family sensor kinase